MRIVVVNALKLFEFRVHFFNQLIGGERVSVSAGIPVSFGFQVYLHLHVIKPRRVGAIVGAARLREYAVYLRELLQFSAQNADHLGCFVERGTHRQFGLYPQRALVELGQKFGAEQRGRRERETHKRQRQKHTQLAVAIRPVEAAGNDVVEEVDDGVVFLAHVFPQQNRTQHRHERQREQQRAEQRKAKRPG